MHRCAELLQGDEFSTRGILTRMNVRVVCTTDDPLDTLQFHQQIADDPSFTVKVLPAYRPDKAMAVEELQSASIMGRCARSHHRYRYRHLWAASRSSRRPSQFFHHMGCRLSDHGIEQPYGEVSTDAEIADIFVKARQKKTQPDEIMNLSRPCSLSVP